MTSGDGSVDGPPGDPGDTTIDESIIRDFDEGGDAPCWAHLFADDDDIDDDDDGASCEA